MKAMVNENCIGCGMCTGTCPAVFQMGNDGKAHAVNSDIAPADIDAARQACSDCPAQAIQIEN